MLGNPTFIPFLIVDAIYKRREAINIDISEIAHSEME
jgi:hypothetical protein